MTSHGNASDKSLQMHCGIPAFFGFRIRYADAPQSDRVPPDFEGIAGQGLGLALNNEWRLFGCALRVQRKYRHGQSDHDVYSDDDALPDLQIGHSLVFIPQNQKAKLPTRSCKAKINKLLTIAQHPVLLPNMRD